MSVADAMRHNSQFDLSSPGSVSTAAILGRRSSGSKCYISCPGGIKLKCCSCRTWMFFCCETLVMALISTLAILYIAHFTDKLAEGGAEVAQQQRFLQQQKRGGLAVVSNHMGAHVITVNNFTTISHANHSHEVKIENKTVAPKIQTTPVPKNEPLWKEQVDYITGQFLKFVSRNSDLMNRLENLNLGKLLAVSAHVSTWSNVLHLRINFEVDNATLGLVAPTQSSNDLRHLRKSSPRRRPTTSAPRRHRPHLLGPMEQAQGNHSVPHPHGAKNETKNEIRVLEQSSGQAGLATESHGVGDRR